MNNILYCGFTSNCLARSLRSHHHPLTNKSDNIAVPYASLRSLILLLSSLSFAFFSPTHEKRIKIIPHLRERTL